MQLLSLNFLIFTIGGVWRPIKWSSNVAKLLYNIFTFVIVVPMYFLVLTQFMDIVVLVDNMDDFTTNSLMFVSIVAVCCKATIAVIRRNTIIDLVQSLLKDPCKPRDEEEMAIQIKFNEFIKSCSLRYTLLATCSCTGLTMRSILNVTQGRLPYRAWVPYYSDTTLFFWIISIQQIISLIFATIINVGAETLIFGFFIQTCAQLEIFENRLHKLVINKITRRQKHFSSISSNKEKAILSEYIYHHLNIFKYAKRVNDVFNQVLFIQFFGSILVLCTSTYYVSVHITDSEASGLIVYVICMFVQIFVYCWSGNEVMFKSLNVGESIYNMDWPSLSVNDKKDLLMIMKRTTIPIKFTSSFLITLTLQSYSNILKASYSAFNVLQQS